MLRFLAKSSFTLIVTCLVLLGGQEVYIRHRDNRLDPEEMVRDFCETFGIGAGAPARPVTVTTQPAPKPAPATPAPAVVANNSTAATAGVSFGRRGGNTPKRTKGRTFVAHVVIDDLPKTNRSASANSPAEPASGNRDESLATIMNRINRSQR